ncbi:MAG: 16S rRNA (guanine(527)-N(7))-methyltransferase RsmG [Lachnospiraceae bacterium]|jgi:16S rRNA (guanine527-N7)-methyltransferase|nr:16S rRNA (guanine(527)-N(7))-methyltransferase RsmG [Lachnospiraceae bacterium]
MNPISYIQEKLRLLDIEASQSQLEQLFRFYELLIEKNKVMNLTSITDFEEVVEKHFMDSLIIHKFRDFSQDIKIIDIGTGAGFPGIPLKILFPKIELVLMDSLNKRLKFLDEVILELGLEQISTLHGRAEDLGQQAMYREQFDFCVSRAVANLTTLSELCLPFVKVGGEFISYKSGDVQDEIKQSGHAVNILAGSKSKLELFSLPDTDISRSFIFIKKEKSTPKKYPRKAGLPGKEPIK